MKRLLYARTIQGAKAMPRAIMSQIRSLRFLERIYFGWFVGLNEISQARFIKTRLPYFL